ncbi:MAG: DNA-binding protein [Deltaproteobacteria bacterium]|nr:DNA-binding protein [Deltaproteobacteria bacterium]
MKYSKAQLGRVFVIRLENGEIVHEEIERFAQDQGIEAATLIAVGGGDAGSRLIVGPENEDARPLNPMEHILTGVHEIAGTGTLFPDEEGRPILHMHMACGRNANTVTGCIRSGVKVWHILEIILFELTGSLSKRVLEKETGFKLLDP